MSQKKTILVVEDEKMLSEAYQAILNKKGYKVYVAHDGQDALDQVKEIEPDLILLDLRMPRMGGIEFLKTYQPASKHAKVKIVVFSNLDSQKEIDEAYGLGAHKYILKAWASPNELTKLVKEMIG
ncbi:response regulator [Candidatus Saccharibacteria bacterium]|nr:response regulator [Candidatus Saccharibacteria bacterium]